MTGVVYITIKLKLNMDINLNEVQGFVNELDYDVIDGKGLIADTEIVKFDTQELNQEKRTMSKQGAKIVKIVGTKKVNKYSKQECLSEIARMEKSVDDTHKSGNQKNSLYYKNVKKQLMYTKQFLTSEMILIILLDILNQSDKVGA